MLTVGVLVRCRVLQPRARDVLSRWASPVLPLTCTTESRVRAASGVGGARGAGGWYGSLSDSAPVHLCENFLVSAHQVSGLPWWLSIAMATASIRTCITLPLAAYQLIIIAKVGGVQFNVIRVNSQHQLPWQQSCVKQGPAVRPPTSGLMLAVMVTIATGMCCRWRRCRRRSLSWRRGFDTRFRSEGENEAGRTSRAGEDRQNQPPGTRSWFWFRSGSSARSGLLFHRLEPGRIRWFWFLLSSRCLPAHPLWVQRFSFTKTFFTSRVSVSVFLSAHFKVSH